MSKHNNEYFARLANHRRTLIPQIEGLMREFGTVPVGDGFIDVITRIDRAEAFIRCLSNLGIAVTMITLWCDCSKENRIRYGCPHGYGGPKYEDGYYSEMCHSEPFDVANLGIDITQDGGDVSKLVHLCKQAALDFILGGLQRRYDYLPCLQPGFWLAVPDNWRRETYLVQANA
jgi:hypothetical protein